MKKDGELNNKRIIYFGLFVAFLNFFDAFATHYGLSNHFIEESNPLMLYVWTVSPTFFLYLKVLLSILIIIISYLVYQYSAAVFQRIFSYTLVGLSLIYSGVFSLHIYWLTFV